MAKEKRRNWLDKISRWILDALPQEKATAPQPAQQRAAAPSSPTQQQPSQLPRAPAPLKPASPKAREVQRPIAPLPEWSLQEQSPPHQPVAADAPSSAPQPPVPGGKPINQAWKAFELAWAAAGLSDHYFLKQEELHQTLAVLDRSFEEELIEWLFQLCTKPEALKDLAGIIERGQVKPTDNIDAIRAFAYVSVAISSNPRLSPSTLSFDRKPTRKELKPGLQLDAEEQLEPPSHTPTAKIQESEITLKGTTESEQVPVLSIHPKGTSRQTKQGDTKPIGNISLEALELSIRSYNCLKRADLHTLLDLAGETEESLMDIKNFGQKSANEVRQALESRGLSLPFTPDDLLGHRPSNGTDRDQISESKKRNEEDLKTLGLSTGSFGLSTRSLNSLYRGGIANIPHLLQHTESDLLAFPNLGSTAIQEIKAVLAACGLSLMDERSKWQAETSADLEQHYVEDDLEKSWRNFRELIERDICLTNLDFEQLVLFCAGYPNDPAAKHLADILARLNASLELIGETLSHGQGSQTTSIKLGLEALGDWIASQLLQRSSDAALEWVNQINKGFTPSQERNWQVFLLR